MIFALSTVMLVKLLHTSSLSADIAIYASIYSTHDLVSISSLWLPAQATGKHLSSWKRLIFFNMQSYLGPLEL